MSAEDADKNVPRFIDPGGEIGRTARIGIGAAHQPTMRGVDAGEIGAIGKTENLEGLFHRHAASILTVGRGRYLPLR